MSRAAPLFLALLICASGARAEPVEQTVPDHRNDIGEIEKRKADLVHRPSGFSYPMQLGEMPARKTVSYGPGDASVYYTLNGGANNDAWLTLYVYPARIGLKEEERNVIAPILQNYQAVPTTGPARLPPGPPGALDGWYRASIDGVDVVTGYRLVKSGRWFIKARVSIPVGGGESAADRAVNAITAIPWTWRESAPAPATTVTSLSVQPVAVAAYHR